MISVSHLADPGLVCRHVRTTGFKLALVVGYPATGGSSKLRVAFWRAASAKWTKPVLVDASELEHVTDAEHVKHARTIVRAMSAARDQSGWKVTL